MKQNTVIGRTAYKKLPEILSELSVKKYLLVCDRAFDFLGIADDIISPELSFVRFDSFTPNPLYEDVCVGVERYKKEGCEAIVALGGGSSLDVAKCIKLFLGCSEQDGASGNFLFGEYRNSQIPLIALPTTAGTGSESTRYAVIYYKGEKQSVTHESIIPDFALICPDFLKTLPLYQKKCTLLDALSQSIESFWSVNSTEESREYSARSIELIVKYKNEYLFGDSDEAREGIMSAANLSGRAINITQTTAPHAMSYKLTSLYGLPHGHSVAISLPYVWEYMIENVGLTSDKRGPEYLQKTFDEIASSLSCKSPLEAVAYFKKMLSELEIFAPNAENREADIELLTASVNPTRLKNNPVPLSYEILHGLYEKIVI